MHINNMSIISKIWVLFKKKNKIRR